MRIALVALLLALPAASAAGAPTPSSAPNAVVGSRLCVDPFKLRPVRKAPRVEARKLGELPPADLALAVVDRVGGCIEPRVVRQRIGR
jgi:hypothetical protein